MIEYYVFMALVNQRGSWYWYEEGGRERRGREWQMRRGQEDRIDVVQEDLCWSGPIPTGQKPYRQGR